MQGRGRDTALQADPKNARRHSDRNKKLIRQSLESVGAGRSILVDAEGIVRAGNGVYEQAQALGLPVRVVETDGKELIAVQRTDLRGKDAIRAAALDNIAGDSSSFDYDAAILAEIARDDAVIAALAKEDARLAELLRGEAKQEPKDAGTLPDGLQYRVIIDCASELHQRELLERFESEGLTCRALIS